MQLITTSKIKCAWKLFLQATAIGISWDSSAEG